MDRLLLKQRYEKIKHLPIGNLIGAVNHHTFFQHSVEEQQKIMDRVRMILTESLEMALNQSDYGIMLNIRSTDEKVFVVNGVNRLVSLLLVKPDAVIGDLPIDEIKHICIDGDHLPQHTVPSCITRELVGDDFIKYGYDPKGKFVSFVSHTFWYDDERLPDDIIGRPLSETAAVIKQLLYDFISMWVNVNTVQNVENLQLNTINEELQEVADSNVVNSA